MFGAAHATTAIAARLQPQRVLDGKRELGGHIDDCGLGGHINHTAGLLCVDDIAVWTTENADPAAIVPVAFFRWRRWLIGEDGTIGFHSLASNGAENADGTGETALAIGHHIEGVLRVYRNRRALAQWFFNRHDLLRAPLGPRLRRKQKLNCYQVCTAAPHFNYAKVRSNKQHAHIIDVCACVST